MSDDNKRSLDRESVFLMAELQGPDGRRLVKIRNLSPGGALIDGAPHMETGQVISINLRNIGPVDARVAWVLETRCGVTFFRDIDPKVVRFQVPNISTSVPEIISERTDKLRRL